MGADEHTGQSGKQAVQQGAERYVDELVSRSLGHPPTPGFGPLTVPPGDRYVEVRLVDAEANRLMGTDLPDTRAQFAKKGLLRLFRLVTHRQVAYNAALIDAVRALDQTVQALRTEVAQVSAGASALVASAELSLREVEEARTEDRRRLAEVEQAIDELRRRRAADRADLMVQRSTLEVVLQEARKALPGPLAEPGLTALSRQLDRRFDALYEAFENSFRGTRDEILQRLTEHLPEVRSLAGGVAPVIDVGCGRGEWLELLRQAGIPGYGIDTNEAFVRSNTERGLDVRLGDALAHLRELPESSVGAVTGFHIIEHISLNTLIDLVDASLRALQPGGLVLFETPNPTNIGVGASAFYLDPTHLKPLHPLFVEFLLLARGFAHVEVRYLHADDSMRIDLSGIDGVDPGQLKQMADRLDWAFSGPQDYAVVGRKAGSPAVSGGAVASPPGA